MSIAERIPLNYSLQKLAQPRLHPAGKPRTNPSPGLRISYGKTSVNFELSYSEFGAGAVRDEGPYGDHLRRKFVSLNQDPALCDVVRDVISGRHSSSTDAFYRLRSSGVVAGESARDMKLRCQLYEQYLTRHLS